MNSTSFTSFASSSSSSSLTLNNKNNNQKKQTKCSGDDDNSSTAPLTLNIGQQSISTTPIHEVTNNNNDHLSIVSVYKNRKKAQVSPLIKHNNNNNNKDDSPLVSTISGGSIPDIVTSCSPNNILIDSQSNNDSTSKKIFSSSVASSYNNNNNNNNMKKFDHTGYSDKKSLNGSVHHQSQHGSQGQISSRSSRVTNGGFESFSRTKFSQHTHHYHNRSGIISFLYPNSKSERILSGLVFIMTLITMILLATLLSYIIVSTKSRYKNVFDEEFALMNKKDAELLVCLTPSCITVASSIITAIDFSVDPCDNFYQFACGGWIKSNPLPDNKASWGTFTKLWQDNQLVMKSVLENDNFKPGSAEHKARTYYESCLDKNDTIEDKGSQPLKDLIQSAGGWDIGDKFNVNTWDLQKALQTYHNRFNRNGNLFSWAIGADDKNSSKSIILIDQASLSLPTRDYFLNKTEKNLQVLDAYLSYMTKVGELVGGGNKSEQAMRDVFEFEKKLAEISPPQDQRRTDEAMFHKFSLKKLNQRAPFLNWTKYFEEAYDLHSRVSLSAASILKPANTIEELLDISESLKQNSHEQVSLIERRTITEDEIVVLYSPSYFYELSSLVSKTLETERGKKTLANYVTWTAIQSVASVLPKNFREASKQLRKLLFGSEGNEVPWRFCISETNNAMGYALGALFVKKVFRDDSKERVEKMIYSIREAFQENMDKLVWMDDKTRKLAREKADQIQQMIGFPDFILDDKKLSAKYAGLELDEREYFENYIKVSVWALRYNMDRLHRPSNRKDWEMAPSQVNAYYMPTKNQIVLPAGILQGPFYNREFPNSLNFGAMGVVLGHELTHAFDDQGREYDKNGNLEKWWNNDTLRNFEERVSCLVEQYSNYKVDDQHINGNQTLGENIADNGGLKASFKAYEKWERQQPQPMLPGLNMTNRQLFFLGFAQVWCSISTPESLKYQALNDVHTPSEFRVIGTLSNSQEFAQEFECSLNSKMNREDKCEVW